MPWLRELGRPVAQKRIPVVLTHVEVQALLARMGEGVTGLLGRLLYGTGMRLLEGVRLRIKDVDFVRQVIVVRDGKGGKDRVVMLPRALDGLMRATASSDVAWDSNDADANADPIAPRSPFRAREPAFPCYHPSRPTPSFTAAATSAS